VKFLCFTIQQYCTKLAARGVERICFYCGYNLIQIKVFVKFIKIEENHRALVVTTLRRLETDISADILIHKTMIRDAR